MAPQLNIASPSSHLTGPTDGSDYRNNESGDRRKGVKYLVDTVADLATLPPEYVLSVPRYPVLAGDDSIPVIDLSGLDGPLERRMDTVRVIGDACAEWGFFRIKNHGVQICMMEEMLEVVDGFFGLNWEEKMKYGSDNVMDPVRYGTSLNKSNHNNNNNNNLFWRDYLRHYGHPFHDTFHLWPHNPSNYRPVVMGYLEEVRRLALMIAGAISEGLGLNRDLIGNSIGKGIQIVASNYYPPCPEPHKTLGLDGHSDHGGISILMQNGVDGLQVKHGDAWVAVRHMPGTFVVNIGDYIEILSNGKFKSIEHRAVVNTEKTRISVAVGHGPELTAVVAPAAQLVDKKSEVKYRPIMYKDYMKHQQSSAMRGKTPLQTIMTTLSTSK